MRKYLLLSLIAGVLLAACQKEISFSSPDTKIASVDEFFTKNQTKAQGFLVNTTSASVVTTSHGADIHIPEGAFVKMNGDLVSGKVDIDVKEILTPADMILNNMPTMAGGLPLQSGGEFNIKASQNGQQLKLAPGKFLKIGIPATTYTLTSMKVFNGVKNAAGSVDWVANANPGNFVVKDSFLSKTYLFCDSVEWINCDKYYNDPTVTFSVYPANAPSNDSTFVLVHLTGRNTVVRMYWTQGLSYFKSDKLLAVPSTIIGVSVKNGQLYASLTPVTVQDGQSVTMNFQPYTEAELKAKLALLH